MPALLSVLVPWHLGKPTHSANQVIQRVSGGKTSATLDRLEAAVVHLLLMSSLSPPECQPNGNVCFAPRSGH
jgi:hypothetical protein